VLVEYVRSAQLGDQPVGRDRESSRCRKDDQQHAFVQALKGGGRYRRRVGWRTRQRFGTVVLELETSVIEEDLCE
jgi:hypothetical protein